MLNTYLAGAADVLEAISPFVIAVLGIDLGFRFAGWLKGLLSRGGD